MGFGWLGCWWRGGGESWHKRRGMYLSGHGLPSSEKVDLAPPWIWDTQIFRTRTRSPLLLARCGWTSGRRQEPRGSWIGKFWSVGVPDFSPRFLPDFVAGRWSVGVPNSSARWLVWLPRSVGVPVCLWLPRSVGVPVCLAGLPPPVCLFACGLGVPGCPGLPAGVWVSRFAPPVCPVPVCPAVCPGLPGHQTNE